MDTSGGETGMQRAGGQAASSADDPVVLPAGDQAIVLEFGTAIDPEINARVVALDRALARRPVAGIVETAPTYRSLIVCYDPEVTRGADLGRRLVELNRTIEAGREAARLWHVPVLYGHEAGLDFEAMAQMKGITTDELVALHSGATYQVYMIGFTPGFAYLGGLPEILHTPRLKVPRQLTPAGGIGIGGMQASVNSVASPSGWRYLGRTPLKSFDTRREMPFVFEAGDRIRFHPVGPAEARRLDALSEKGEICAECEEA
ncbi:5-oxoprolinase subunit PxpB [Ensifer soli]|uniref:5-oxoprolinase subunit PxpB n=1 Tax=Ciceribacter sp. sgz301302 TaxID=3342379 RepID=UPI0035B8D80A